MKKAFIAVAAVYLLLLSAVADAGLYDGPGISGQLVERVQAGEINWTKNTVRASGRGSSSPGAADEAQRRLMARRAAKLDALRNLLEAVGGVRIDSTTTVESLAAGSDSVRTRVSGLIKGAYVVDDRYLPDGSAEVVVEAPMAGILADAVYSGLPDLGSKAVPRKGLKANTGLVVDAKGMGAKPAMSPKIVDEDGKEVYGSKFVNREQAVKQGVAGYAKDVDEARESERVRSNPIIIRAIRTVGKRGTEIVIRNSDSAALRDRTKDLSFLAETRVIIVME